MAPKSFHTVHSHAHVPSSNLCRKLQYIMKLYKLLKEKITGSEIPNSTRVSHDTTDNWLHEVYVSLYIIQYLTFQALFFRGHFTPSWCIHTAHR